MSDPLLLTVAAASAGIALAGTAVELLCHPTGAVVVAWGGEVP